jgi:hypothetical protein
MELPSAEASFAGRHNTGDQSQAVPRIMPRREGNSSARKPFKRGGGYKPTGPAPGMSFQSSLWAALGRDPLPFRDYLTDSYAEAFVVRPRAKPYHKKDGDNLAHDKPARSELHTDNREGTST